MSKANNQKNYDIWSAFYDSYPNPTVAIDELSFPSFYSSERDRQVLEIGCGTGRHTRRLASQNKSVTALDASEGMLEKARKKVSGNVVFLHGDILSMEVPGAPFDLAVMSLVLEHIADLKC